MVVRQVYDKAKKTIYKEIIKVIHRLGLEDDFKVHKSPIQITHKATGNIITFAGMDDVENIKGTTVEAGQGFALLVIEEAQQTRDEDVRSVRQTLARGYTSDTGSTWRFKTLYLSNPSKQVSHYTNNFKTTRQHLHLLVNYVDLTHFVQYNWLGEDFIEEAEYLEEVDEELYNFEYLCIGMARGLVFKNIRSYKVKEYKQEEGITLLLGLDFGITEDPSTVLKLHYNSTTREVWVLGEIYKADTDYKELSDKIKEKGWGQLIIRADNADPGGIRQLKIYGINNVRGVEGKTKVDIGIDWVRKLKAIHIDEQETPETFREFTEYDKVLDKYGNIKYSEKNNHTLDAFRYGLHEYITGKKG